MPEDNLTLNFFLIFLIICIGHHRLHASSSCMPRILLPFWIYNACGERPVLTGWLLPCLVLTLHCDDTCVCFPLDLSEPAALAVPNLPASHPRSHLQSAHLELPFAVHASGGSTWRAFAMTHATFIYCLLLSLQSSFDQVLHTSTALSKIQLVSCNDLVLCW